jgi:hypothetical protein
LNGKIVLCDAGEGGVAKGIVLKCNNLLVGKHNDMQASLPPTIPQGLPSGLRVLTLDIL